LHDSAGDDGVLTGGVAADDEHTVRILDFGNGVRHGTRTEGDGKTCHRGGVSEACAVIDVVGAQDASHKFHKKVVFFVGAFGAGQSTNGIRPVRRFDVGQSFRDLSVRFFPADLHKSAILFDQGLLKAVRVLNKLVGVSTQNTKFSLTDGVTSAGDHIHNFSVLDLEIEIAPGAAKRTGGQGHIKVHFHPPGF